MGCCFPCFKSSDPEYAPINDQRGHDSDKAVEINFANGKQSVELGPTKTNESMEGSVFHAVPDRTDDMLRIKDFDQNSPVFKGSMIDQKFSNKSSYDSKFAWINLSARTLNLSDFNSKERRHKEASLSDVISVIAGPPDKYRPSHGDTHSSILNENHCLSVKFVRGGGIDFKFKSTDEREMWYGVISKLVMQQKKFDNDNSRF